MFICSTTRNIFFPMPETARQKPIEKLRDTFYDRIRRAFTALEDEVAKGRISAYGVSSNTFGAEPDEIETTSATRMWEIAGDIALARTGDRSRHHFSVIQLPANLFESGPVFEKNNGEGNSETVLDFAIRVNLGVLVNRPLNAIVGGQMVRLADFNTPEIEGRISDHLAKVAALEAEFGEAIAPLIKTSQDSVGSAEFFRWATELANPEVETLPVEHWMHLETQVIQPQVTYLVHQLDNHLKGDDAKVWEGWRDCYPAQARESPAFHSGQVLEAEPTRKSFPDETTRAVSAGVAARRIPLAQSHRGPPIRPESRAC